MLLPKTLRSVGGLAFKGRKKLKKVQLPEGLDRICRGAFAQCNSLEDVVIPAMVVSIDGGAFSDGKGLKKVTLMGQPNCVARTAFAGCDQLDSVVAPDDSMPHFSENVLRVVLKISLDRF